jgi:hypothetical protein
MAISLIAGYMQSGKTKKTFNVINKKVKEASGNTLVLFITQFNNSLVANQTFQRSISDKDITDVFDKENILKCENIKTKDFVIGENVMIVGFWHSRNMKSMLKAVRQNTWFNILIVIDEADQGGNEGFKGRMKFIDSVYRNNNGFIKIIFITATIVNLSFEMENFITKNRKYNYVKTIRFISSFDSPIEFYFVDPPKDYISPMWLIENAWEELILTEEDLDDSIINYISKFPIEKKKLTLYIASVVKDDHDLSSFSLLEKEDYNVCVIMNSNNPGKYVVKYKNTKGEIKDWIFNFAKMNKYADEGLFEPVINSRNDYTLSHILHSIIYKKKDITCDGVEKKKLLKMTKYINIIKPSDFPEDPITAIIAGIIAGRGISIQNQAINFVCSSYIFIETYSNSQAGAINAQKIGRACGLLLEYINKSNTTPTLLTSKKAMIETLASMEAIKFAKNKNNVSLGDLVSKDEWKNIISRCKDIINSY